jgi:drug/metabolite transporter (DMT)-like permease
MPRLLILSLILLYAASGASGDLMLSYGMKHSAWWVAVAGVGGTAVAYAVFLGMLRKLPCSVVVPTQAGNCIVTVVACALVLHETIPPLRWLGTLLVCGGVAMVLQSHPAGVPVAAMGESSEPQPSLAATLSNEL